MKTNRVKKVIQNGNIALGTYVSFADSQLVEIIGISGFDAAFIDMEHTAFDLGLVQSLIQACDLSGITSIVRVPDNDEKLILRILDMGAEGIVIPHVQGLDGAIKAVSSVRYPPMGKRGGAGTTRAARYGSVDWHEHVKESNREILLSVMVEDRKAIDEIDEISQLEGIDLIAIGPTDLSQALGAVGPSDPRLMEEIQKIAERVSRMGGPKLQIPMGHPALPLTATDLKRLGVGYTHVAPAAPSLLLKAFTDKVKQIHTELKR